MKYLANTSNRPITYKGTVVPPRASILLNNKGEVIDEITDNKEELSKARKSSEEGIEKIRKELDLFKESFKFDKESKTLEINL